MSGPGVASLVQAFYGWMSDLRWPVIALFAAMVAGVLLGKIYGSINRGD